MQHIQTTAFSTPRQKFDHAPAGGPYRTTGAGKPGSFWIAVQWCGQPIEGVPVPGQRVGVFLFAHEEYSGGTSHLRGAVEGDLVVLARESTDELQVDRGRRRTDDGITLIPPCLRLLSGAPWMRGGLRANLGMGAWRLGPFPGRAR